MKTRTCAIAATCITIPFLMNAVHAGSPETYRLFGVLDIAEDGCFSPESETSRRIVSRGGGPGDSIQFITVVPGPFSPWTDEYAIVFDSDGNEILNLSGTVWTRMPIVHVTSSGADQVSHVYWLVEDLDGDGTVDPPVHGMNAATGPDGDVIEFVEIRIARASSSDSWNPNRFYITSSGGTRLCIAVGLFKK